MIVISAKVAEMRLILLSMSSSLEVCEDFGSVDNLFVVTQSVNANVFQGY